MTIGTQIRRLRDRQGLTQAALAARCGIDQAAISRIETGDAGDLRAETLRRLADTLGTTMDWLVGRKPVRGPLCRPDFVLEHREPPDTNLLVEEVSKHLRDTRVSGNVCVFVHTRELAGKYTTAIEIKRLRTPPDTEHGRRRTPCEQIEKVIAKALAHPKLGCDRLSYELRSDGIAIGSTTIQGILQERQLNTREQRALMLQRELGADELSAEQIAAIERITPRFRERLAAPGAPGEHVAQDVMPVGSVRLHGGTSPRVLLYSAVDTYSSYAFAALVPSPPEGDPAMDILTDHVVPWLDKWGLRLRRAELHRSNTPVRHWTPAYEKLLAEHGVKHIIKDGGPLSSGNGFVDAFEKDIRRGFLRQALRREYESLQEMQHELDEWLETYNGSAIEGYPNLGRSPVEMIGEFTDRVKRDGMVRKGGDTHVA